MKRVAICLFGMSYRETLPHWGGAMYQIDARPCKFNHDKYIVSYFKELGYEIDYYLSTNTSEQDEWYLQEYKPVYANFDEYSNVNEDRLNIGVPTRAKRLLHVLQACLESTTRYDMVIAIRFDLLICKPLHDWSIDFENFNVLSVLERPIKRRIDDNLYILNSKHLESFVRVLYENQNISHHDIYGKFCIAFDNKVNLMYNENKRVDHLTSVKILRTLPDGTNCISLDDRNVSIDIEDM